MVSNTLLLTLAAALTPLASAAGSARVINHCPTSVTLWSVGASVSPPFTLAANTGTYAEPYVRDPVTGGKALKITKAADGLYTGAPQLNFAYSLDGATIWYDLSSVFGDVFPGRKLVVASLDGSCPAITWPTGTNPGGSQTKACTSSKDVALVLCAEGEW
ncbi:Bys1 family protein [Cercophora newfieldiana]|uniref:Bys1 family protein n=1 Tax=Cercophora newfieldiana TaxID=92897 RepID=A0AA39YHB2_9PEZI|nr:Bys1 family protein [Cercophora newfieldiana]